MRFQVLSVVAATTVLGLSACGTGEIPGSVEFVNPVPPGARATWDEPVPKAACGPDDLTETALQGQVSMPDRASGRAMQGYNCNLERIGHAKGEGSSWQMAWYDDCAYYDTAVDVGSGGPGDPADPRAGQQNQGVAVLDVSDPANPQVTTHLNTIAMLDPWESLKVNHARGLLGAVYAATGNGGPEIDIYDVKTDCTQPTLLASVAVPGSNARGHEGEFAPDGMTYYGTALSDDGAVYPMDVSDPSAPKLLLHWLSPDGGSIHGLSLNEDGTRAYLGNTGGNGLMIVDTSQVQARVPEPDMPVISTHYWDDSGTAQHSIPLYYGNSTQPTHVLFVDELGVDRSCQNNKPHSAFARLIDVSDETAPFTSAKLKLETHDPANCEMVTGDNGDAVLFQYDSHYCSVDAQRNPSIAACGYFASGLRVFDIRDPHLPREIAYYNPPPDSGYQPGSNYSLTGVCGTADWTTSAPRIIAERSEIWFTSQCNDFQVLRFRDGVWPFSD